MNGFRPEVAQKPMGIDYYAHVIRRQWRVIAAGAILGGLIAGGYLLAVPTEYTATTDVKLNVISSDPFNPSHPASTLLDDTTETQVAGSYAVAEAAAKALGGNISADTLRGGSLILASAGAAVVHIGYTAPSSAEASKGADAIGDAYLAYRATEAQRQIDTILGHIQDSLTTLQKQLAEANARAAAAPKASAADDQATSDRDRITAEINNVLTQKSGFEQIDTSGGSVLTPAARNSVSESPSTGLTLLGGVLAGGVLGLIVAFPVNTLDRKIRSSREVVHTLGALVVAEIRPTEASLPAHGPALDALRSARERVFGDLDPNVRSIAVFDDSPGPEASDVPVNFALVVAQSGRAIELIIASPTAEFREVLRTSLGLTKTTAAKGGTLYRCKIAASLTVYLPSDVNRDGETDSNITQQMRDRLEASEPNQLTMLVLPPRAPHSSRLTAGRITDAALLVVATNSSRSDQVTEILDELSSTNTEFLGVITVPRNRALALADAIPAT